MSADTIAALTCASKSAAVVYLALLEQAEQRRRKRFFISYRALRRLTGIRDDRTVKAALNALNAAHWIKRDRRARRGKDGKWLRHERGFVLKFNRVRIRRHANFVGSCFHSGGETQTANFVRSYAKNVGSQPHSTNSKDCISTTLQTLGASSTKKARGNDAAAPTAGASGAASPAFAGTTTHFVESIPIELRKKIEQHLEPDPDEIRIFNRCAFAVMNNSVEKEMSEVVGLQLKEAKDRLRELATPEDYEKYLTRYHEKWTGDDVPLVRFYATALDLWLAIEFYFGEHPKASENVGEIPIAAEAQK